MEFYEAVEKRRTVRDFKDEPIDPDALKRILGAGMKAPSNDHMRDWHFIVLEDKEQMRSLIKKIPKTMSPKRAEFVMDWMKLKDEVQRDMYQDALPKQYQMLLDAGCLIIPLYRQYGDFLKPKDRSALNAYASIWLCIENIFLAATAEGYACSIRIPLGQEKEHVQSLLHFPDEYEMPCYIGLGRPADNITPAVQKAYDLEERIHKAVW